MAKSRKWIAGAIKRPGTFSAQAKRAGESTHAFAEDHKSDSGTTGKRARLALTLAGMNHKKSNASRWYGKD